jgi:DNA replication and repair protein RecF
MRSDVVAAGVVPARNVAAPVVAAGRVRTGSDMAVTRARPAMTSHNGHSEEAGAAEGQREDVGVEHEWDGLKLNRRPRWRRLRADLRLAPGPCPRIPLPYRLFFGVTRTGTYLRLERLVARGFRNLADLQCDLPAAGLAILGSNGQGKTNLLEAFYYPVLFRSLRGSPDQEVTRFGGLGFHVEAQVRGSSGEATIAATYTAAGRKKRIAVQGEEIPRLADAIGHWLAVAFLPADVGLAAGPAAERRRFLDRLLALSDHRYYTALARYRAALAQRNAALRTDQPDLARAFDRVLAESGTVVVASRLRWVERAGERFAAELDELGESQPVCLRYHGRAELADSATWPAALEAAAGRDQARRASTVGPHRDDLVLELGGRSLRSVGSTGQQRTAAVALKLLELDTLADACGTKPALLLDDVFAELDVERQGRFARRLGRTPVPQVFITAPRADELPAGLELERWRVEDGRVG